MASPTPLSKLELSFKAKNLLDLDVLSKSDPRVWVYMKDKTSGRWLEVGTTEQIDNNLNPVWSKSVVINFFFEEVQNIRFVVYDIDEPTKGVEAQELIGSFDCTVAQIVGARGAQLAKPLANPKYPGKTCGVLIVSAEEVTTAKSVVRMQLRGVKLDKKDFFGKSDPFIRISRIREDRSWDAVHSTEVIKNTLDPKWAKFEISVQKLCNGDPDRQLKFECFDWNKSGKEDPIGEFETTLTELVKAADAKKSFTLMLPSKKHKSSYKGSGTIFVDFCEVVTVPSFVDYIQGGCDLNLIVAVDFTASNGEIGNPQSLHYYRDPQRPNEYQQAIMQVGTVLQYYDTDNNYPAYGFGALIPPTFQVSHCFPLTYNWQNPEVHGVNGILSAYQSAVTSLRLHGPTNFAPIIQKAVEHSRGCNQSEQKYTILLIITDGVITDMAATKDAIVEASTQPLSIVIVGVGSADFSEMNILDADDTPLVDRNGRKMARDIVQFVPFRDFKNAQPGRLAEAVLAEMPDQMVGFFRTRNIRPNPKQAPLSVGSFSEGFGTSALHRTSTQTQPTMAPYPEEPPFPNPQQQGYPPQPQQGGAPYPTGPYPGGQNPPYPYPGPQPGQPAPYPGNAPPYPMNNQYPGPYAPGPYPGAPQYAGNPQIPMYGNPPIYGNQPPNGAAPYPYGQQQAPSALGHRPTAPAPNTNQGYDPNYGQQGGNQLNQKQSSYI